MTRQMVDSAYPLKAPPPGGWPEIILIYAGGDTPHPWTTAEILSMPARYRWPCWVRSDPQDVNPLVDAAAFAQWLYGHKVPTGTAVILDLETAVHTVYVNTFNAALRAAGYLVTKYGSTSTIWLNPRTDGGTFVADPGPNTLTTVGDTVARQYGFDGTYDRSIVKDQAALPLWDTKPAPPPPPPLPPEVHMPGIWKTLTILPKMDPVTGELTGYRATGLGTNLVPYVLETTGYDAAAQRWVWDPKGPHRISDDPADYRP